jgi:U3 small nucleolar RNA-associated protein 10
VGVMQKVYKLANSAFPSSFRMEILKGLFVNLEEEALAFLAGMWTNSGHQTGGNQQHFAIALYHAAAFLEANKDAPNPMDFQTILPSFIVALHSENVSIRQGAVECIHTLASLSETQPTSIYSFDTIYGDSSSECLLSGEDLCIHVVPAKLQYLEWEDLKKYLVSLDEQRDHFSHDATFISVFHHQHLARNPSEKKDNE